jgi:diguanylate cyclase (GGDEF)-like protein/PAS domain S-box-containing protein
MGKILHWIERQLPVADKIGIPLAAIAVLTAAVLSANTIALARKQINQEYADQVHQLANVVQANVIARVHHLEDLSIIGTFLKELKQVNPSVLEIHIYRFVNGKPMLWASSNPTENSANFEVLPEDIEPIFTGKEYQTEDRAENRVEIIRPLKVNGQTIGSLSIYMSLEPRDGELNAATRNAIFASAIGITAQSIALMLVLYWAVLRRVARLSKAAALVAAGDITVQLPEGDEPPGRDEIIKVAHEFDRMLKAVRRRTNQQNAIAELGQRALTEIDLSEFMETVVHQVAQTLKSDYVDIFELLPNGDWKLRAGVGWQPELVGQVLSQPAGSQLGYTLLAEEPVVVQNLQTETRFVGLPLLQEQGIVSSISVLVVSYEQPFGVLSSHSRAQQAASSDDVVFLQAVATLLSAAIKRQWVETALARAEAAEAAKQALEQEIIDRQRIEAALRESEERYALAASGANDGLWDWNLRTNEAFFSPRWKSMLGYEEDEISTNPNEWFHRVHPEDIERVKREMIDHRKGQTSHFRSEHRLRQKDNTYCWMLVRGLAVRDETGDVYRIAGSQTDISIRKAAEEKLLYNALHDELTGLANRVLFMDRLDRTLTLSKQKQKPFAVLFLDLDRFKVINDSLGHLAGDQLLITTAERLKRCLRSRDTCARLGGDEFAILLEEVQDQANAIAIVERIQQELKQPLLLEGQEVFVAASIGLIIDTTRYNQKEALLRDADTAMYCAKAAGRGCYAVFTEAMHDYAVTLLQLETDLRRAVEREEFQLLYQPILSLRTNELTGIEALLRWHHPSRGVIMPTEFIPIAEDTGLIIPIGEWVLHHACRQMQMWQQQYNLDPKLTISVNLSGKQFTQPDLVSQLKQILQETGLTPASLKLEITESVIMTNARAAAQMMVHLKQLGVQLAMDDFGTGYSSLSYLHQFPIDTLKIDRSFITSADTDLEKLEITRTVIALAWNLGMDVVAEGVETDKQMAQLKLLQCELAQGYLFSEPLNSTALSDLLSTTR